MKNSETDKEIMELIKTTLDNFHEDYIPGAWENFVNVRKRKKRIIFLRVASAAAACLITGLIGYNYFVYNSVKQTQVITENKKQNSITVKKDSVEEMNSVLRNNEISQEIYVDNKTHHQNSSDSGSKSIKLSPGRNHHSQINFNSSSSVQKELSSEDEEKNVNPPAVKADSLRAVQKSTAGRRDSVNSKAGSKKTMPSDYKYRDDPDLFRRFAENDVPGSEKRKIRIGINFSPGVNSTSTGSSLNYSGGVSTDIALFDNFLLSTGLQLEHQSVVNGAGSNPSASVSSSRTKADLVNLDLPLNITWKFFSDKSKSFYISGGVSSLAYLSEKYDKTTSVRQLAEIKTFEAGADKLSYKMENFDIKTENKEPSFNTIDIAGRVNIIFGVEQRLSPKLYLHLEPYMKIPVSGLASENLRFSTGGVTCKISF
jgi:hypothetical protein